MQILNSELDKRLKEEDKEGLNQLVSFHICVMHILLCIFCRLARLNRSSKREKGRKTERCQKTKTRICQKEKKRLGRMEMSSRKWILFQAKIQREKKESVSVTVTALTQKNE